jgi:hypothetical protein
MKMSEPVIPNFKWYSAESRRQGISPRCPFQSVHACPRYYQSLSLLGKAGCTAIPAEEDEALSERWKRHPLWPTVAEQATGIAGDGQSTHAFHQFCPEVSFDRFGYFATFLAKYAEELDSDMAAQRLGKEGASADDPRWAWQVCTPQHYSECPLYSCLAHDWTKQIATFSAILPPTVRYDVFISHASEDKESFVRGLAAELTRIGLRVWFDEWTLQLGDSLRRKIDEGLRTSSYGVVVLSPSFFTKNWPQAELNALFAIEMSGRKVILPVRHTMSHQALLAHSPTLAGLLATDSAIGIQAVANQIHHVVRGTPLAHATA